MGTTWQLECLDHDPPLRSDEVEQHTNGNLEHVAGLARAPEAITERGFESVSAEWVHRSNYEWNSYFINNAIRFVTEHPRCRLALVNEHDERREL